jgi:hypothetical protein
MFKAELLEKHPLAWLFTKRFTFNVHLYGVSLAEPRPGLLVLQEDHLFPHDLREMVMG